MMMVHCAHSQQPLRARATKPGGSFSVLFVVLSLVVSSTPAVSQQRHLLPLAAPPQLTAPTPRSPAMDVAQLATEDPRLILQHAATWQREGRPLSEPLLRQAVAAALHPDASW